MKSRACSKHASVPGRGNPHRKGIVVVEFKEILVPIDFSDRSIQAIDPAFSLARLIGGKVFLLHVIDLFPRPNPMYAHYAPRESMLAEDLDRMEAEARKKLESLVPRGGESEGVRSEVVVVRHTTPHECIVEQAEKIGADTIVLAHKGWSTLVQVLVGSVTEQVIRHARCPVMVIRAT